MKCRCGAKYRVNYPHGKKGKAVISFEIPHKKDCKHNKNETFRKHKK